MKSFLKVIFWLPASVISLVVMLNVYSSFSVTKGIKGLIRQEISSIRTSPITFAALPKAAFEIKTALAQEDARPLVINNYLADYGSPFSGMGEFIVQTADQHGVDPYLVVAIAQQESNLGKLMPENCHNAWGWGIHSAGTLCFDTWAEGFETFTKGIATKYHAYGLNTPDEIMTKYVPHSPGGAWAKGVNQFMSDLQNGNW